MADAPGASRQGRERFAAAYETLLIGADVVGTGLQPPTGVAAPGERSAAFMASRARLVGNALRELDRFLNVLADELAQVIGVPAAPRQHNTANKLRDIGSLRLSVADHRRLRALGRSRERLARGRGLRSAGDGGAPWEFAARGAADPADRRGRSPVVGDTMVVTGDDLASIAAFYRRLATTIARAAAVAPIGDEESARPTAGHGRIACRPRSVARSISPDGPA
jgi:hypothetical protein